MSERYTHGHHESVLRTHSWRTVENSAAYLIPSLREGMTLLDVGSGPGTMTIDFARRLSPGLVIGIDAAPDIVVQAAGHASEAGVPNVEFRVGDAYRLDFPDNTFDVVHVHQTLQHVSDPVAVLQEMWRVAKPGGVIAAREVDYAGTLWFPELPGLDSWMRVYQQVHRGNGGEPNAGRRLRSWAQAAGLTSTSSTASAWCYASDAERELWGGAWATRSVSSAFAPQAIESGAATAEELQEISQAWTEWSSAPDGWLLMPHAELVAIKEDPTERP